MIPTAGTLSWVVSGLPCTAAADPVSPPGCPEDDGMNNILARNGGESTEQAWSSDPNPAAWELALRFGVIGLRRLRNSAYSLLRVRRSSHSLTHPLASLPYPLATLALFSL